MIDFETFWLFLTQKIVVLEILKTVPESSQYQLSFSIKIFWKFQTNFSEIAKTYNKMLLYPWYGYRLHVFSSYLWWKLNNNSLSLYLARPLNFYRQMFDAGPYFSRSCSHPNSLVPPLWGLRIKIPNYVKWTFGVLSNHK